MNNSQFSAVCFGEVLWDILPDKKLPGGAPMNVAYHLNQLGIPAAMISRIGDDTLGRELIEYFTSKKVAGDYIQTDPDHDTSRVLAKVEGNRVTYDIVKPVAWDFIVSNEDIEKVVDAARFFIFGSLGARSEVSRNTLYKLLELADYKVLDINLRPPHYEKKTLEYLLQKSSLLKLNDEELQLLSGWYGWPIGEKEAMKALQDKFRLNTIIATRGENGAIVLHDGEFCEHPGFKVQVADTIGSGDAFLAGFIFGFSEGRPLPEVLEFAGKMGAFMATHPGACPQYQVADVRKLT